ncbi:MAG: 6-carboxytetrahydropterin synthase [Candidatus Aminicenantes bacterium]|nr:6-carboxytetrahydropterin synthase [Candidatus Aminicenantes bacterium]
MSWILKVRGRFSAAHFLREYQGECEKIHGHTFRVEAEIEVRELDRAGLGIDFAVIKRRLAEILPDHKLLNDVYAFNPSAENLARRFFEDLAAAFPVRAVTVWESEDASATYAPDR